MIWVEILSRHHEVIARHRIDAEQLTIGRGYGSDIVIDDPMVAAKHLLIAHDSEGRLLAVDSGSRGGVFDVTRRKAERQEKIVLTGHTIIRIGHTLLRVRDHNFVVAAEQGFVQEQRFWPMAILFFALSLLWIALEVWCDLTRKPKMTDYAIPLLIVTITLIVWTLFWAMLSRVFAGNTRFFKHLAIATLGYLVLLIWDTLSTWSIFAFSWRLMAKHGYFLIILIFSAICYYHMRAMGETHLRLKAIMSASLAVLLIAAAFLMQKPFDDNVGDPPYLTRLEPPQMRFSTPQDEKAFLDSLTRLQSDVEKDRQKAPGEGDASDEYEDEE